MRLAQTVTASITKVTLRAPVFFFKSPREMGRPRSLASYARRNACISLLACHFPREHGRKHGRREAATRRRWRLQCQQRDLCVARLLNSLPPFCLSLIDVADNSIGLGVTARTNNPLVLLSPAFLFCRTFLQSPFFLPLPFESSKIRLFLLALLQLSAVRLRNAISLSIKKSILYKAYFFS